jgi:uncharacterized membrane protein
VGKHLISPNIHVIMVHFPLGIFIFGLFLEVFGFLWRRSTARIAARWMILFGALMSVPAAFSGIDALKDVYDSAAHSTEDLSDQARVLLQRHLLWASLGAGLAAVSVVIGLALSEAQRNRAIIRLPLLIVLLAAAGMMGFGSHFGGEGVYLESVAVKLAIKKGKGIEYYAPARSTHILMSGFAVAVGLGALGASLRVLSSHRVRRDAAEDERDLEALESGATTLYTPPAPPRRVTDDVSVARTLNADVVVEPRPIPSSRFWLLTSLLALAAFGLGVWLMMQETSFLDEHKPTPGAITNALWETATSTNHDPNGGVTQNRRLFHIAFGATLVVLPLILAAGVRWMAGSRLIVGFLCLLLVAVVAAQIWTGILLTHDEPAGPLLHFAPQPTVTADGGK